MSGWFLPIVRRPHRMYQLPAWECNSAGNFYGLLVTMVGITSCYYKAE